SPTRCTANRICVRPRPGVIAGAPLRNVTRSPVINVTVWSFARAGGALDNGAAVADAVSVSVDHDS
ncbi:MAG: hypothetical protein ACREBE_13355, partial [bacterium]